VEINGADLFSARFLKWSCMLTNEQMDIFFLGDYAAGLDE
jgi:hypothetical protein